MTIPQNSFSNTFKVTSLIFIASILMACQGETSTQADAESTSNEIIAITETSTSGAPAIEAAAESLSTAATTQIAQAKEIAKTVSEEATQIATQEVEEKVAQVSNKIDEAKALLSSPVKPVDLSQLDSSKYQAVNEKINVSSGNKIEVTELFWFGCGHCFALEPHLKAWIKTKPANAKFKKVPAIFSKRWEFHGKAFYTMQALNVPEEAYDNFFKEIHLKRKNINSLDQLTTFLSAYGKDQKTVENAFNSFAVDSQLRNAIKITRASGARGVPAMVVNGKYLTSETLAGSTSEMFKTVDLLVAKSASER